MVKPNTIETRNVHIKHIKLNKSQLYANHAIQYNKIDHQCCVFLLMT